MSTEIKQRTKDNLMAAFAGESQANRKYLAFAEKAEKEGFTVAAKLFRAAAEAETIHAHNHLRALGGIRSTEENLKEAIEGENFENTRMYPAFIKDAKTEEEEKALRSFVWANEVEAVHRGLYEKALDNLGDDTQVEYYICTVCGNTVENAAPEICSVCGMPKNKFKKVD